MSKAKEQYMESLQYELHSVTNDIMKQTNIQRDAIAGIMDDLQELANYIREQEEIKNG